MIKNKYIYDYYDFMIKSIHEYCVLNNIKNILPAPTSVKFEFAPEKSMHFCCDNSKKIILPASNTFHKQLACYYLGDVCCVAPCYRRELSSDRRLNSLDVFHQIEFEFSDVSILGLVDKIKSFFSFVFMRFNNEFGERVQKGYDKYNTIDMLASNIRMDSLAEYDVWSNHIAYDLDKPVFIIYTPQTPKPCINKTCDSGYHSYGVDLIFPNGYGEILSGGERDKYAAACFFDFYEQDFIDSISAGFGVGLERLMMYLFKIDDISNVLPLHYLKIYSHE